MVNVMLFMLIPILLVVVFVFVFVMVVCKGSWVLAKKLISAPFAPNLDHLKVENNFRVLRKNALDGTTTYTFERLYDGANTWVEIKSSTDANEIMTLYRNTVTEWKHNTFASEEVVEILNKE